MTTPEQNAMLSKIALSAEKVAGDYREAFNKAGGLDQMIYSELEKAFLMFAHNLREQCSVNDITMNLLKEIKP